MLAQNHVTHLLFWPILFLQVDLIRCQGCLELAEPCTSTGTLGNCCSSYCHQILGQPLGTCQLQNVTWDTLARRTSTTTMKPPSGAIEAASTTILIAVSVVLAVLVAVTAVAILFGYKYFRTKNEQRGLSEEEIKEFRDGNPKAAQRANSGSDKALLLPFADEFAIPTGGLIIDRDAVLGEGEYGIVWRGHLYKQPVAVKTVKEKADVDCVKAFLKELKIQAYIGKHPHIVEFYGAEISQLRERIVYAVVELSPEGNLLSYLRANSQCYFHTMQDGLQIQSANQTNLTENAQFDSETVSVSLSLKQYENVETRLKTSNLLRWCAQIAEAMAFLGEKKVIHGDLATRNVLVFNKNLVKVSDFGLSRQLYQTSQYVKKQAAPLPWRWMAIESLKLMEFSSQSDVWAFGVTVWEIFSFGNAPFPGLSWTLHVVEQLEKGLRMTRPKFMNQQIYNMLLDCWRLHPADRPVFTEIHKCFQNLLDTFLDRETSTENT